MFEHKKGLNLEVNLKWLLVAIALICVGFISGSNEAEIPVIISRRHGGDSITFNSTTTLTCSDGNNLTYLIEEQRCARNEEFLNSCIFSIAPSGELSNLTLTLALPNQQSSIMLLSGTTVDSRSMLDDAVVVYRGTNQPLNSSLCLVSNLEVYRGRDQITEIESDGFSLNEMGFVEINTTDLVYNLEEYRGEFYRMNLSCSDGGLPESGCLFFKVIGITNITSAKFDKSVPGTIYGREEDTPTTTMSIITTTSMESTTDSDTFTSTTQSTLLPTTQMSNTTNTPGGVDSRTLMYAIYAIAAVGVVALLVVVLLLCAVIAFLCCSSDKKREHKTAVDLTSATNLPSEPSDSTSDKPTVPGVNIPITQQDLPPPPKWDPNPAYNVAELSTSWNEGSNV